MKRLIPVILLMTIAVWFPGCAAKKAINTMSDSKKPVDEVIPLTMATMRGHKILYDEGWFVVTSSREALEYAKEKSFRTSRESMTMIAKDLVRRTDDLGEHVTKDTKKSYKQAKQLLKGGTAISGLMLAGTWELSEEELAYSKKQAQKALERLVKGNISLVKRGPEDVSRLKRLPGQYYTNLKDDFSNLWDLSAKVNENVSRTIALSWDRSFDEAAQSFKNEYEESGTRPNTLVALGDILTGYLKAFYQGLARPGAKSLVEVSAKGANTGLFLPGAAVTIVSGRTVEATGLTLVFTARSGYQVIAPTVEAGFMGGLSLVSLGSVPVTVAGGTGLAAVNQVAFTTAAPVYGVGKAVTDTTVESGKYVALVTCDVAGHSSNVMINHAKSAVVLGYNALTAIPVHLFLGTFDTAVFLGWDGPKLVVAMAKGQVTFGDGGRGFSMGDLPAGTVVDLEALRQQKGVEVKVLTDDPAIISNVFEKLPGDLKGE